jgi:hypothetical protein
VPALHGGHGLLFGVCVLPLKEQPCLLGCCVMILLVLWCCDVPQLVV